MASARSRIVGRFDAGGTMRPATVILDRGGRLFTVRPYRRRRLYTLPLSAVADRVVWNVVKAEVTIERRAKARRGRR